MWVELLSDAVQLVAGGQGRHSDAGRSWLAEVVSYSYAICCQDASATMSAAPVASSASPMIPLGMKTVSRAVPCASCSTSTRTASRFYTI